MTFLLKMFRTNKSLLLYQQGQIVVHTNSYSRYKEISLYRNLLIDKLNVPERKAVILVQDGTLRKLSIDHIEKTCKILTELNVDITDLNKYREILYYRPIVLENMIYLLEELGFKKIDTSLLFNFKRATKLSIFVFKAHAELPSSVNLAQHLYSNLQNPPQIIPHIEENINVQTVCQICMKHYLKWKLEISDTEDITILNAIVLHGKSFRLVEYAINALQNELHLSKLQLKENIKLLFAYSRQMIPTFKKIQELNFDVSNIIQRLPSILLKNMDDILAVIKYIESENISNEAIKRCPGILTLHVNVVKDRMKILMSYQELHLFRNHSQFLSLIYNFRMVEIRLRYLNDICERHTSSMSMLTSGHTYFKNSLKFEKKQVKIDEIVMLLNHDFKKDEEELKDAIRKHPYWKFSSLFQINKTFTYLKKFFSLEDIFKNLYAVFYPRKYLLYTKSILSIMHLQAGSRSSFFGRRNVGSTELKKSDRRSIRKTLNSRRESSVKHVTKRPCKRKLIVK